MLMRDVLLLGPLTEKALLSSHLRRRLLLDLLLGRLQLRVVLMQHLQTRAGQARSTNTGVHHGYHIRRHTTIQRLTQHRLLDLPLLKPQLLLPRPLFFLLPLVLFGSS